MFANHRLFRMEPNSRNASSIRFYKQESRALASAEIQLFMRMEVVSDEGSLVEVVSRTSHYLCIAIIVQSRRIVQ